MATGNNFPATELPVPMFPRFDPTDREACLAVLENLTTNAEQIQEAVLEHILSHNAQTEYLRECLHGRSDKQTFKQNVPIITYEDFRPYMDRIVSGELPDIICAQPVCELSRSSGTSGGLPKLLPVTAEEFERRYLFGRLSMALFSNYLDGLRQGKEMNFHFMGPESETASGLMVRSSLTGYMKRLKPKVQLLGWDKVNSSPYDIIVCQDTEQSMYCQLLCGLVQRDEVAWISTIFASTFLKTIKFLEDHWHELCLNIRTSHVSDWIKDHGCRTSMSKILNGPNPELAGAIEQECSKRSWEAIVRRLWPRAKYIEVTITGAMAQYIPMLEFYGGGLPLVSPLYGSSECYFGLNLDPLCKPCNVSYTIFPNMAYFEFLEVEPNHEEAGDQTSGTKEGHQVVDLVDVKMGHYYEPVVTTFTGLYRFRMGDVLRATGFYNYSPQFQFVGRQKVLVNIDVEKTSEEDLLKAVTRAKLTLEPHRLMLTDFTSHGDISSIPGHYVLYWEVKSKFNNEMPKLEASIFEECCVMVEESLHVTYRRCRNYNKTIGPLEIKVVTQDTFDVLMNFFVSRGSSMTQYKTPRGITDKEALRILDSRVVAKFVSQKPPTLKFHELHSIK